MAALYGANVTDANAHGSASIIDDLHAGDMTGLTRIYRTATGNNQFFLSKLTGGFAGWYLQLDDSLDVGAIAVSVSRASNAFRITTAGGALISLNTWYDVGFTWSSSDNPTIRIYLAPAGQLLVESATYHGASGNGSGAIISDASAQLVTGNLFTPGTNPIKGRQDLWGLFPSKLTPAQMQRWFRNPGGATLGCVAMGREGRGGVGATQADYSGNGNNGTITGATLADPPPRPRFHL